MFRKKMFHIGADFELSKKPNWLDNFRKRYDKPYNYHITLKNPTYFNGDDLKDIKLNLKRVLEPYNKIKVIFKNLFINPSSKGECIMIRAEKSEMLVRLQKEISTKFFKYAKHISKKHSTISSYTFPCAFFRFCASAEDGGGYSNRGC